MAEKLFSKADRDIIIGAIRNAEKKTSGEIQVHIENHCKGDVLDRAAEVFEKLKMHKTAQRNAVLFYLAVLDHKFAILGDAGIEMSGKQLQQHFPYDHEGDINELPDEISFE